MPVGMLYAQVTAVPVYLPDLRLSIAVGIEGFSEAQWATSLQNMELKVMQNVKFNTDFGNPSKLFQNVSTKVGIILEFP